MRSRAHLSSHPIHPILVVFPIGLWWTSFVFDVIGTTQNLPGLWSAGWYAALAGIFGGSRFQLEYEIEGARVRMRSRKKGRKCLPWRMLR